MKITQTSVAYSISVVSEIYNRINVIYILLYNIYIHKYYVIYFIFNETSLCLVQEENIIQNCTDIAMPVCAIDQVVKMELTPNGCKRFICGMYCLY